MEDEITTSEAAEILKVLPRQVRWYFEKQLLPGRLIAGRLVFLRADVLTFVKPKRPGRPPKEPPAPDKAQPAKKRKGKPS